MMLNNRMCKNQKKLFNYKIALTKINRKDLNF